MAAELRRLSPSDFYLKTPKGQPKPIKKHVDQVIGVMVRISRMNEEAQGMLLATLLLNDATLIGQEMSEMRKDWVASRRAAKEAIGMASQLQIKVAKFRNPRRNTDRDAHIITWHLDGKTSGQIQILIRDEFGRVSKSAIRSAILRYKQLQKLSAASKRPRSN